MRVPLCGLTVPGYIFVLKLVPQDKPYFWSLHQSLFPPPLFAFFSSKIRKMPLNFEISKVLKCPSMLGLPALHSWLLAIFRVTCKLLDTAWSSFRPLAPYFLPFLRSLFQWGWPQKQLFSCAPHKLINHSLTSQDGLTCFQGFLFFLWSLVSPFC